MNAICDAGWMMTGLVVFAAVVFVLQCAVSGYLFAAAVWHVPPRNNLSHVLGGLFGFLVLAAITGFFASVAWGVAGTLLAIGFVSFAVRLQRGY